MRCANRKNQSKSLVKVNSRSEECTTVYVWFLVLNKDNKALPSDSLYNLNILLYAQVAVCYDRKVVSKAHCVSLSIQLFVFCFHGKICNALI